MTIHAITAVGEAGHITPADDAMWHAAVVGSGSYVMEGVGNSCELVVATANQIAINSGLMLLQGRWVAFEGQTAVAIESGTSGQFRRDCIYVRRSLDSVTMHDVYELLVLRGQSASSAAAAMRGTPEYASNSLFEGSDTVDIPIAEVLIEGVAPTASYIIGSVPCYPELVKRMLNDGEQKDHSHDAGNITSGVLPIAQGGTGRAETAKGAMYSSSDGGGLLMGTLPIGCGGTGKTTAAEARAALSAAAKAWTEIARTSGTNAATIDVTGYSEVTVVGHNGTSCTYLGACSFPVSQLTDEAKEVYLGGGWTQGGDRKACAKVSKKSFKGVQMVVDGNVLSNPSWRLYAR